VAKVGNEHFVLLSKRDVDRSVKTGETGVHRRRRPGGNLPDRAVAIAPDPDIILTVDADAERLTVGREIDRLVRRRRAALVGDDVVAVELAREDVVLGIDGNAVGLLSPSLIVRLGDDWPAG